MENEVCDGNDADDDDDGVEWWPGGNTVALAQGQEGWLAPDYQQRHEPWLEHGTCGPVCGPVGGWISGSVSGQPAVQRNQIGLLSLELDVAFTTCLYRQSK